MSANRAELRDVSGEELRTIEGGLFAGLFARVRSAVASLNRTKELDDNEQLLQFEIQN